MYLNCLRSSARAPDREGLPVRTADSSAALRNGKLKGCGTANNKGETLHRWAFRSHRWLLEGQVEDDARAYRLQGVVVAVVAEGIEAADADFDEAEVHDGHDGNVYAGEAHVLEVGAQGDAVGAVEEAVVGAADAGRALDVRLDDGTHDGGVEDGADAEERRVDASAAAVGGGEGSALGGDDAAAQVGSELDRAQLEEVVVDAPGAAEGRNVVFDSAEAGSLGRRLDVAHARGGEGSVDAELGLSGGGDEGSDGQEEECFAEIHVASSLPAGVF